MKDLHFMLKLMSIQVLQLSVFIKKGGVISLRFLEILKLFLKKF
ncbi:hypothetical protein [Enterococcus devriesei]|nr:hypothetical protein [Enterococcus devriesei]